MNQFKLSALALLAACSAATAATPNYRISSHIPAPPGSFDYLSFDSKSNRLFIARDYGVMAVDVSANHVIPKLVPGHDDSAVLILSDSNEMLSTNWGSHTATLFDRTTGKIRAVIHTGKGPDAAIYDALAHLAYVMNTESHDISVIDVPHAKVLATTPLGEKPEAAALDAKGHLYVNLEESAQVAIIDTHTHRVVGHHQLPGCTEPTGIAYDNITHLLISACHNGVAKLIDANTGHDHGSVPIGRDADGAIWDAKRRYTYVPAADGTLTIFHLSETGETKTIAQLPTAPGARTAALDEATGRLYIAAPVANPDDKAAKGFEILVVSP